ncbi:hypothetical protein [Dyadobacter fermentans]|uniref:DUF885 domain-containing protein n=1 Tax=Dyadobacter fermentans (strain ATCC 700827 / DSM 18053 / CIP 107007 / KCTC 52180 / NS114) TaxID=471854 RepID=C6W5X7_DYAFD|nr:hypothetical protein [Dyadobacter fermentans]ACT96066.1 conserved hypothetical protein [Dyadobacter fermentans DSM 18053]
MLKNCLILIAAFIAVSCSRPSKPATHTGHLDSIAHEYVKLGLSIGRYDGDFVDAYYGPDSLRPAKTDTSQFPKEAFLRKIAGLKKALTEFSSQTENDTAARRARWMSAQLTAFQRRVHIFSGTFVPFDAESKALFDAVAPVHEEQHFRELITRLDALLPGKGPIPNRYQALANRFLIPKDKIDTVFRAAITEARKRTMVHYTLPAGEDFRLEYVEDKPWSGYNWYKGNYKSVIQINVSQPIYIERAIDLACHEGYPGHHVYNALLEKNLFRDKGWTEISLYPLFSPQSLIAEGSANYGISMAFPGNEQQEFCKKVLIPLAGLDTAQIGVYFEALAIRSALNYARNEVARGMLDRGMSDKEAKRWLTDYCLLPEKGATDYLRFIRKYRSYVINYNYGQDIVKKYIESQDGGTDPDKRWKLFEQLLSNESKAGDLLNQ